MCFGLLRMNDHRDRAINSRASKNSQNATLQQETVADLRWGKMGNCPPPLNGKLWANISFCPPLKTTTWILKNMVFEKKCEIDEGLEGCHVRDINLWADKKSSAPWMSVHHPSAVLLLLLLNGDKKNANYWNLEPSKQTVNSRRQTPVGSPRGVSGWTVVGLHGSIRSVCIIFYC